MTSGRDLARRLARDARPLVPPGALRAIDQITTRARARLVASAAFSLPSRDMVGEPAYLPYVEAFVSKHAELISGAVLRVGRPLATEGVVNDEPAGCRADRLDVSGTDPEATIAADLCADDPLIGRKYDCEIVLDVLQSLPRPEKAVANLWQALRPGGSLLVSVPTIAPVVPGGRDFWRFTPEGLRLLLTSACDAAALIEVGGDGSLATATALLHGLPAAAIPRGYSREDARFCVVATALVTKAR